VLSSVGIQAVVEALAPEFERMTGHELALQFDLASAHKTKIEGGEAFDVAILTPPLLDDLIAKGLVTAETRTDIARVGLGLMIRAGAPKPDLSSVDAFKRTLLDAASITYAPAGASGIAFLATAERLGIAAEVAAKAKPGANGEAVGANVTSGAAEVGVLPISEILPVQGAELGGVFPAEVQTYVVMVAGIGARSTQRSAAQELLDFLRAPGNAAVIRAKGMDPRGAPDDPDLRRVASRRDVGPAVGRVPFPRHVARDGDLRRARRDDFLGPRCLGGSAALPPRARDVVRA
jgi:molybdate transport system substrate-binding protein